MHEDEHGFIKESEAVEDPVRSLLRSARFWENEVGSERYSNATVIAAQLRVLAEKHSELMRIKKSGAENGSYVIAQPEGMLIDQATNTPLFFQSSKEALDHLSITFSKNPLTPASLVYKLNENGIPRDEVLAIELPMKTWSSRTREVVHEKGIMNSYPLPLYVFRAGLE